MTKEQEHDDLHHAIWQIANNLRGSVNGWDFKSYVSGMLFCRSISEKLRNHINKFEREAGKLCRQGYRRIGSSMSIIWENC